ncbi:hypothetical protein Ddye_018429, partial [Dipteronia dyeriana]
RTHTGFLIAMTLLLILWISLDGGASANLEYFEGERVNDYGEIKTRRMWVTKNYYMIVSVVSVFVGLGIYFQILAGHCFLLSISGRKKGDITSLLKSCCMIVKCFIDTDTSFNPMHSK